MNRPCPVHLDARLSDEEFEAEMSNAREREMTPAKRLLQSMEQAAAIASGEQPAGAITIQGHRYVPASALTAAQNAAKDEYARRLEAEARVERLERALNEIDAHDPEQMIDGCSHSALRGLVLRMGEIARQALEGDRHA